MGCALQSASDRSMWMLTVVVSVCWFAVDVVGVVCSFAVNVVGGVWSFAVNLWNPSFKRNVLILYRVPVF